MQVGPACYVRPWIMSNLNITPRHLPARLADFPLWKLAVVVLVAAAVVVGLTRALDAARNERDRRWAAEKRDMARVECLKRVRGGDIFKYLSVEEAERHCGPYRPPM